MVALVQARHVYLAKIAEKVNRQGSEASRERWVRRQLDNSTLDTWQLLHPLAECLLKGLVGRSVYPILDPTSVPEETLKACQTLYDLYVFQLPLDTEKCKRFDESD